MTTSTLRPVDDVTSASGVRPDQQSCELRLLALRSRLEIQREFRVEQLAALEQLGVPGPLGSSDREVFASLAAGARVALAQVRAALQRMDNGTYGGCTSCGADVDVERLQAVPSADRCGGCQGAPGAAASDRAAVLR